MFFYFVFVITYTIIQTASVSAINQQCPYRTGTVYVLNQGIIGSESKIVVNFENVIKSMPVGIVLAIRSIQISQEESTFIDFNFSIQSYTTSKFNMSVKLNKVYYLNYTKIIIDYWTNQLLYKQKCLQRIPQQNDFTTTNFGDRLIYTWMIHIADLFDQDTIAITAHFFIVQVIGQFPNRNISIIQYPPTNNFVFVNSTYIVDANSNIHSLKLSGIIYANDYTKNSNYTVLFRSLNIYKTHQEQLYYFSDDFVQATLFLGLGTILCDQFTNKIGFYFGYDKEYYITNTLQGRQNRPSTYFKKIQKSSPRLRYAGRLAFYALKQCPNDTIYIYLQNLTQLCHDKCPTSKYSNSNNFCVSCVNCTDIINICPQCLSNGCEQGFFIQPTQLGSPSFYQCTKCSLNISGCQICFVNSTGGPYCSICNQRYYLNSVSQFCYLCKNIINDCQTCTLDGTFCLSCLISSKTQLKNGQCHACSNIQYYDQHSRKCRLCHDNSSYPYCIQKSCGYSIYNYQTKECQLSQFANKSLLSFTTFVSIPTMNIMIRSIKHLVGLFDDLSYFTYHKRKYSESVELFIKEMLNFTLMRFVPFQIEDMFLKISFSYSSNGILDRNLDKAPQELIEIDQSVYFLLNTEHLWVSTLTISVAMFLALKFVHYLINRCFKNDMFKIYNYSGLLIVSLLSQNIQYLSFRCFSQLFQPVPLGPMYYFNLVFCYIILFFILIYSISSVMIFKLAYHNLNTIYIINNIFNQSWIIWLTICNLFHILTGFIHTYFYYYSFLQSLFLTLIFLTKAIIFTFCQKHSTSMLQFSFQLVHHYIFVILQLFFFFQTILIQFFNFQINDIDYLSDFQNSLIILVILIEVVRFVVVNVSNIVIFFIEKYSIKSNIKQDMDIKIRRKGKRIGKMLGFLEINLIKLNNTNCNRKSNDNNNKQSIKNKQIKTVENQKQKKHYNNQKIDEQQQQQQQDIIIIQFNKLNNKQKQNNNNVNIVKKKNKDNKMINFINKQKQ